MSPCCTTNLGNFNIDMMIILLILYIKFIQNKYRYNDSFTYNIHKVYKIYRYIEQLWAGVHPDRPAESWSSWAAMPLQDMAKAEVEPRHS